MSTSTNNNLGNQTSSPSGRFGEAFRLGEALTFILSSNKKFYLQVAGVSAGISIVIAAFMIFLLGSVVSSDFTPIIAGAYILIIAAYLTTCSAFIVSDIPTKAKRIAAFMVPESKLEKFAARYIHLVIFIPLAGLIGLCIGDALQAVLSLAKIGNASSVTLKFFEGRIFSFQSDMLYIHLFLCHSIMLVLGVIIRRRAWLKSILVLIFAGFVLSIICFNILPLILNVIYGEHNYGILIYDTPLANGFETAGEILLAFFFYWLAFRIYSRMQVVTNKWHNL